MALNMQKQEAVRLAAEFLGGRSVLIVDPFANYRSSLKQFFANIGVKNVITASTAEEAKRTTLTSHVGIYIVEWILEGTNGLRFFRDLQSARSLQQVVFLLMSAENMKQDIILASEVGVDGYMLKPFSYEDFVAKIAAILQQAVNPSPLTVIIKRGERELLLEQFENAEKSFLEAKTLDNNSARALCGLARIQLAQRNEAVAINFLHQALQLNPEYLEANRILLKVYEQQGNLEGIEKQARTLHDLSPENPRYTLILAQTLLRRNSLDESEHYFKKALHLSPTLAASHRGMGDVAMKRKEAKRALKYYQKALDLDNNDVGTLNSLGMAYIKLEKFAEGIKKYMLALSMAPTDPRIHFNLGQAYEKQKRWEDATDYYQKALALSPEFDKAKRGLERIQAHKEGRDIAPPTDDVA